MRQPRTFGEAENAARLTQTVQQSIQDAKGTDTLSRIQQQLGYCLRYGKRETKRGFRFPLPVFPTDLD